MQSFKSQKIYSLRADANALGGYLEKPLEKLIPTLAPVSLPAVGGLATARSEAFILEEIVSCSAAYTKVSGRESRTPGKSTILVTAVVENLNILEVVRAERVVAQVSIEISAGSGSPRFTLAGSAFEGLWLAGQKCIPTLNTDLQEPQKPSGDAKAGDTSADDNLLSWEDVQRAGRKQSETLLSGFKSHSDKDAYQWALGRHKWMSADEKPASGGYAQASLVDGLKVSGAARSFGHIVEIPHFGRIILGELLISRDSVQLVGIRAELGCATSGRITACCGGGGGTGEN